MSEIGGFVRIKRGPCPSSLLQRMSARIVHRGPDVRHVWHRGPVGLFQNMLHTTPESLAERQPLWDEASGLCLAFNGRVDNRDDLKRLLEGERRRNSQNQYGR